MEETVTWRDLLKQRISDVQERRRIAKHLGVHTATLTRWATKQADPRQENLLALLDALPHYRLQLIHSMQQEFPRIFQDDAGAQMPLEIPSGFYDRVFRTYTRNVMMADVAELPSMVVQQVLGHLGSHAHGMEAIVAQCVAPACDGPGHIRSLRKIAARGTPPWESHPMMHGAFFGIESPLGQAVAKGRAIVVESKEQRKQLFPSYVPNQSGTESELVQPIMLHDKVMGCLYLASTAPNYFNPVRQELAFRYAMLLVLAFDARMFYAINQMFLGIMPALERQKPALLRLQEHIKREMYANPLLSYREAEPIALRLIQEELLRLTLEIREDIIDQYRRGKA